MNIYILFFFFLIIKIYSKFLPKIFFLNLVKFFFWAESVIIKVIFYVHNIPFVYYL